MHSHLLARGARLTAVLMFVVAVFVAGSPPASAHHLMGADSGFDRAITIRVARTPGLDVAAAVAPWNRLAGRRLFVVTSFRPQIRFVAAPSSYVTVGGASYRSRFTTCTVHYASKSPRLLAHELGHCLGFGDHVRARDYNPRQPNPAVCDDTRHAQYSRYRGIMSHCAWNTTAAFGPEDRQMLVGPGYVKR